MTLANRARQVADAAPRHQSAAVLRECADEIARLKDALNVANALNFTLRDQVAMLRNAAKSRLKCPEGHRPGENRGTCWFCDAFGNAERVKKLTADLAALRAVVRESPGHKHGIVGKVGCEKLFEGGPDRLVLKCICGADESNAALAAAKKMAGGE